MSVNYTTLIRQSTLVLAQIFSWSQQTTHRLVLAIHTRTLDSIASNDATCFSQVEADVVTVSIFAEKLAAGASRLSSRRTCECLRIDQTSPCPDWPSSLYGVSAGASCCCCYAASLS